MFFQRINKQRTWTRKGHLFITWKRDQDLIVEIEYFTKVKRMEKSSTLFSEMEDLSVIY